MDMRRTQPPQGAIQRIVGKFMGNEAPNEPTPSDPSQDWEAMSPFWEKVNDIVEGQEALRKGADKYLPRFPNESKTDYEFRRKTSKLTNIYRDIVEGLSQKPFAKELTLPDDTPDQIMALVEDIDGRGNHLNVFAAETFFNGINKAIDWILVDFTESEGLRTVEDEKKAGVRPYWVHIPAEKVIWVESEVIAGREQLTFVKILERPGRVRQFTRGLDEDGNERVIWEVLEEPENPEKPWILVDSGNITIGVIPMVPFVTGRRKGASWKFSPPMSDAADLQIELYQQETNLKHVKNSAAFPMLAGNGVTPDTDAEGNPKRVPIGPHGVLYAPPGTDGNHGEWKWIEPTAESMKFLAEDVKETAKELREIGRQPLTAQSANMTVIGTAFAAAKGNSAVQQWAFLLKDALENAFYLTALWLNTDFSAEVTVFTDFGIEDTGHEVPKLLLDMRVPANGQGEPQISQKTLWEEMKRRGILSAEFNPDTELDRLFEEFPGDPSEDDLISPEGQNTYLGGDNP